MKQTVKYIIKFILIWSLLNFILNELSLFIRLVLFDNFSSFLIDSLIGLKYIGAQTVLFGIVFTTVNILCKNKILSKSSFVILQSLIFHLIFLMNIDNHDNKTYFSTTENNFWLRYISLNGTDFTYFLHYYFPLFGHFEGGQFIPENIYIFYFLWIFTPLIYFALLTWLTIKVMKHYELKYKL